MIDDEIEAVLVRYGEHAACGDATALSGAIDFVLINLWKDLYIPCFELIHPELSEGAFVAAAADNVLHPELFRDAIAAYRRHARGRSGIESILLPVGSGMKLGRYSTG